MSRKIPFEDIIREEYSYSAFDVPNKELNPPRFILKIICEKTNEASERRVIYCTPVEANLRKFRIDPEGYVHQDFISMIDYRKSCEYISSKDGYSPRPVNVKEFVVSIQIIENMRYKLKENTGASGTTTI